MRHFPIALSIAFLCLPIFASAEYDGVAGALIFQMLLPNETFSYSNFTEGEVAYYLVSIGGTERFLVRVGPVPPEGRGQPLLAAEPVLEASSAVAALKKIRWQNGSNLSELDKLESIHLLIAAFESSRTPGEHKCDILIGMDEHHCIDFESCQKSCYSRTSFCQPLALGIGRPLIEAMFDYSNGTKNLTLLLAEEDARHAALSSQRTAQNLDDYLSTLTAINVQATKINNNMVFYGYQICFPPNYDMASLTRAKLELLSIYAKAIPILRADEEGRQMAESASSRYRAGGERNVVPEKQTAPQIPNGGGTNGTNVSINASENKTIANGIPSTAGVPSNAMAPGASSASSGAQSQLILISAALVLALLGAAYFLVAKKKSKSAKQEMPKKK